MTNFFFNFSDGFLYELREIYSSDHEKFFLAESPFYYHIWDHKLKTTILSGCLKEFEKQKPKYEFPEGGGDGICYDANGKPSACNTYENLYE